MSTRLIIDGNAVYEIDEACETGRLMEKEREEAQRRAEELQGEDGKRRKL